jgi:hypothetical protein
MHGHSCHIVTGIMKHCCHDGTIDTAAHRDHYTRHVKDLSNESAFIIPGMVVNNHVCERKDDCFCMRKSGWAESFAMHTAYAPGIGTLWLREKPHRRRFS